MNDCPVLFVGGYARSGKSTLMRLLRDWNFTTASTSQYLDQVCELELVTKTGDKSWLNTFSNKSSWIEKKLVDLTGHTFRSYKIQKAEKELVPSLGRLNGLIKPALEPIMGLVGKCPIAIETIGGEEYHLMLGYLKQDQKQKFNFINLNCHSNYEKKGVDIRVLLPKPCLHIYNNEN
jgi:ribosome biogenesis GTPase A